MPARIALAAAGGEANKHIAQKVSRDSGTSLCADSLSPCSRPWRLPPSGSPARASSGTGAPSTSPCSSRPPRLPRRAAAPGDGQLHRPQGARGPGLAGRQPPHPHPLHPTSASRLNLAELWPRHHRTPGDPPRRLLIRQGPQRQDPALSTPGTTAPTPSSGPRRRKVPRECKPPSNCRRAPLETPPLFREKVPGVASGSFEPAGGGLYH